MIEFCQSMSTLYSQEFQIRLKCAGNYQQYICMSFKYDRFVPVFIHSIFERVSNTIVMYRSLSTVYFQELQIR